MSDASLEYEAMFQQFSIRVSRIAETWSSPITRFASFLEYTWRRRWSNKPLPFAWVGIKEGEPMGNPVVVEHLTLHDMMEHQACGILTDLVLLHGLRANAFSVISRELLGNFRGMTKIQPRWI
jgi:hypothetical protein